MSDALHSRLDQIEKSIQYNQISNPLDVKEAAAFLHVSVSYIYKLTHKKLIPYYKPFGKKIYFLKKELKRIVVCKPYRTIIQMDLFAKQND